MQPLLESLPPDPVEVIPEKKKKKTRLTGRAKEIAAAKIQALDELGTKTADIAAFFGIHPNTVHALKKIKTSDVEFFKDLAAKQFAKDDWEIGRLASEKIKEKLIEGNNKLWEITGAYKVVRELQRDKGANSGGNLIVNISGDGGISFTAPKKIEPIQGEIVE